MTSIPDDIMKAARAVYVEMETINPRDRTLNECALDYEKIARALLAERERCAAEIAAAERRSIERAAQWHDKEAMRLQGEGLQQRKMKQADRLALDTAKRHHWASAAAIRALAPETGNPATEPVKIGSAEIEIRKAWQEIDLLRSAIVRFGDRMRMATVEPIELQQAIDRAFENSGSRRLPLSKGRPTQPAAREAAIRKCVEAVKAADEWIGIKGRSPYDPDIDEHLPPESVEDWRLMREALTAAKAAGLP